MSKKPEKVALCIRGRDDRIFDTVVHTLLIIMSLFFVLPFLNVISQSISESSHVIKGDVYFWPRGFSLEAFEVMFVDSEIPRAFMNSVFVCSVGCVLSVTMTAIAAYPIVFSRAPGRKLYSMLIMITHWFSAGLVPGFIVMTRYGLLDSYAGLILMGLISAYNVLVVKSFYYSIPINLVESARIDGAKEPWILFRLVMPLSKPVLATVAMWVIVQHWNNYLMPSIYLKTPEKFTLQLVLRNMIAAKVMDAETTMASSDTMGLASQIKYAAVVISMLPMLCIYPFFQRFFVKGVMIGAVKG